ncbi:glutathione S-transferase [Conidiobolus coronatus NRRL 28638]|uniref:Glutathione S-transferase n=1 Tax=Conidiobolus coronatus (strain ATCC 28846 / CBS 209.66 / NRRL 28638) TaxID=796925 RepID=A0A137P1R1_CONC2|nr:glutathione S-transferase [Conidiobolus coronatus NRRL 28638]|eukprot:KXN68819.1 glutathione S-transferase [Conidiobolus coronatus NRRL 28638]
MVFGKIYGCSVDNRAHKSLLVAEFTGITLETTPDFKPDITNKSATYLSKFPLGQTPAFEGSDGLLLTESAAIAFHVAQANKNTNLLGKDSEELAIIWQLIVFMESNLTHNESELVKVNCFNQKLSDEMYKKLNSTTLYNYLDYLNNYIYDDDYLVGDSITLADINLVCNLNFIYGYIINAEQRAKYSNLTRYYENMLSLPQFRKVIGEVKYQN